LQVVMFIVLNIKMPAKRFTLILAIFIVSLAVNPATAHENHFEAVKESVSSAGFSDTVEVTCEGDTAIVKSNTYPDHELMTDIVATNEQVAAPAIYAAPVRLSPLLGVKPQTRDAALGIAVNGVPIYDYTGGGEMTQADLQHHQTRHDTFLTRQLDICGGHAGRADDYHYHMKPDCMINQMKNAGDDAIIGWAFDGFPIYGDNNPDGSPIEDAVLDVCNGQADSVFGYRYHTSDSARYIVQCLMGEIDSFDTLPRVRPMKSVNGGPGPKSGRPPAGGVGNLIFNEASDGKRRMEYNYNGDTYYIEYKPSSAANCFQYTTRTVTNNGSVESGEYCRK